jgi:hypothetical protein
VSLELQVPEATVIPIRDEIVVEHEDFVDDPTLMKEVEEQVERSHYVVR